MHFRNIFHLSQFFVNVGEHFVEIDGVRGDRKPRPQTAEQVGPEADSVWRASWLQLAAVAAPLLRDVMPLLARQLSDSVRVLQRSRLIAEFVLHARCQHVLTYRDTYAVDGCLIDLFML